MKKNREIKVIHLPTTIGGNPQGLSKHLKILGVDSESWTLHQNQFGFKVDKVIAEPTDSILRLEIKKLFALSYVFRYQVIFFNFGSTLFNPYIYKPIPELHWFKSLVEYSICRFNGFMHYVELWILRLLRRKIFVQYQGDDARQGDYCLANFSITAATEVEPTYYTPASDALKRSRISTMVEFCQKIYALNPDLLHVLPASAEFLPYSHISLSEWTPHYTQLYDRPLRIGHAPTHRGAKGTAIVQKAVKNLKKQGLKFEFELIEGLSNAEAKERYKNIDILVDQLFFGWYGGLAVEAMALGKPVIVYVRDEDLKFLPQKMQADLPIINTTPSEFENTLRDVIEMPREDLYKLAKKSREYVEIWHNPLTIAERIKKDIEEALRLT